MPLGFYKPTNITGGAHIANIGKEISRIWESGGITLSDSAETATVLLFVDPVTTLLPSRQMIKSKNGNKARTSHTINVEVLPAEQTHRSLSISAFPSP